MPSPSLNKKLTVTYSFWKKLLFLCLGLPAALVFVWAGVSSNFYLLEVTVVVFGAYIFRQVAETLGTRSVTFFPDKILKNSWFGATAIPTHALVLKVNKQDGVESLQFFHGTEKNSRESISVAGWCLSEEHRLWLDSYRRKVYRIGDFSRAPSNNSAACVEFEKAVASFRFITILTILYLLIYVVCATYLSWHYPVFNGYAPTALVWPIRVLFVAAALAAYPLLRLQARLPLAERNYSQRVQRGHRQALRSALLANGVAWLGLPLCLLCGNKLDFYMMLLVGGVYHRDFYPRLSDWEQLLQVAPANPAAAPIPRRSLQVSLALLGGLSLAGYAGQPADFRIRQDCTDANANPAECDNSHSGGHGGGSGSSYRGGSDDGHSGTRRGGFGSFGGSHGFFGG
ncbi:hypothetical protein [Methylomonas koyamae]|uniref:hypothetical protein n=1 Tax=Methylomonas koyamae TaxID=702114 RepID=UPI0028738834|nr:hypothetical protein [Methylomonas koyamae]WNB74268.1 hypothetical protein RI210_13385 [Methylomonas koyamae]